jgi:hypothetical protein
MATLFRLITGLLLIGMLATALVQTYGWLGLIVYIALGWLLIFERVVSERQRKRREDLLTGHWWRELT